MAWPDGQTRRVKLTVQNAQVSGSGTHVAFPVFITRTHLPDEMCSPTNPNRAQVDGGDVRAAADNVAVSQLPIEIEHFEYDSTDGAGDADIRIWVKRDIGTATDTDLWLGYNTVGTTSKDAVTAPFGRNAVWSTYSGVWHLTDVNGTNTLSDSTGNGHALTPSENFGSGRAGPLGGFVPDFNKFTFATTPGDFLDAATDYTFQTILYYDLTSDTRDILGLSNGTVFFGVNDNFTGPSSDDFIRTAAPALLDSTAGSQVDLTNQWLALTREASSKSLVLDGVVDASATESTAITAAGTNFVIGNATSSNSKFDGILGEVRAALSARSTGFLITEFNNQKTPATFIVTGAAEGTAGGGGSSIPVISSDYRMRRSA